MKKILILTLSIIGLNFSNTWAQQDAKAKGVLDKMSAKINGMSSMKANFNLIAKDAKGKVILNENGVLQMKGENYNVSLGKQVMISDGKTMWTYMAENKEVQISNFDPDEVQFSPKKIFPTNYAKEYNYTYAGERVVNGKKVDIIYLTPKNKKNYKSVTILVDKTGMITSGSIEETNGGYYTLNLKGVQTNAASSDAIYTFDASKYPGVEVIDIR
ncbi:MAG TPA: outer membrane lipoprotein carrier protein LolA [Edaphocola sp.]|nr:outer membrane lipoprotein carrier protein LolA [Edaphocola sp.]